jgi:hypothetical protein
MKDFIIWFLIVPPTTCCIFWVMVKTILYIINKGKLI